MNILDSIIPRQYTGSKTGATSKYEASTRSSALAMFNQARYRLLDVNNWYKISGEKGAKFQLTNSDGTLLNSSIPEIGNLIRIELPAPPNKEGDGYDWVRIEKFESDKNIISDEEVYGFRVRPVSNPDNWADESAHFYTSEATSTFLLYRKLNTVYAMERGRNEVANTSVSFLNKIRNLLVAIPAKLGLSKPQWKNLVNGILNPPNNG